MNKRAGVMALLVLWGCQTELSNHGMEPTAQPFILESTIVTGEVRVITGVFHLMRDDQGNEVLQAKDEIYVVREETGNEVPVHVDEGTKSALDRKVSTGDRIEAAVSQNGYAVMIKPAQ